MFEMSLKDGFLDRLAEQQWWRDLLAYRDPDNGHHFFVGVRSNYLSVYFLGKAVFKKVYQNDKGAIVAKVDRRYFDGASSARGDLVFDGKELRGSSGGDRQYSGSSDLAAWVKMIKSYPPGKKIEPGEKECLADRAQRPCVVNLEMALPGFEKKSPTTTRSIIAPRIDMVELERADDGSVRLVFTEAKLFSNTNSLRADPRTGKPAKIFQQVEDYENYIRRHERAIREAYHEACRYLIEIRRLQGVPVDELLGEAAESTDRISLEYRPRLLVFRTNKDKTMREANWEVHHQALLQSLKCEIVPTPG